MAQKGRKQDVRTTLREIFEATRATAAGELTDPEFRFWMMVRSMEGADRGCYADTEYMMMLLRRSESHVKQVRPSLARKGWLEVTQRGPKNPELRAVVPSKGVHENEPLGVHQDEPLSLAVNKGVHKGVHPHEPPPTTPNKESTGSTERQTSNNDPDEVLSVFEYWCEKRTSVLSSTRKPKPTDKRLSKVRARLREGRTVDELQRAVDGCLGNQFNVEGGYIDLELICRDDQHVTQYVAWEKKARTDAPFSEVEPEKAAYLRRRREQSRELTR